MQVEPTPFGSSGSYFICTVDRCEESTSTQGEGKEGKQPVAATGTSSIFLFCNNAVHTHLDKTDTS